VGGPATRSSYTLFERRARCVHSQCPRTSSTCSWSILRTIALKSSRVDKNTLRPHGVVFSVGLEPVGGGGCGPIARFWVVNHLSDRHQRGRARRRRQVRACRAHAARRRRALAISCSPGPGRSGRVSSPRAHRGQNVPFDPQLSVPGVGRADVWVFDASLPDHTSSPLTIITLFTDTPRAPLAVTPDGSRVYAAGFHTGNRTTIVGEQSITDGFRAPMVSPGLRRTSMATPAPEVGAIVFVGTAATGSTRSVAPGRRGG